jgi:hypothetical protein
MVPLTRDSMKCDVFWAIEICVSALKSNQKLDNFKYCLNEIRNELEVM